jgi:hypothetical protein
VTGAEVASRDGLERDLKRGFEIGGHWSGGENQELKIKNVV